MLSMLKIVQGVYWIQYLQISTKFHLALQGYLHFWYLYLISNDYSTFQAARVEVRDYALEVTDSQPVLEYSDDNGSSGDELDEKDLSPK